MKKNILLTSLILTITAACSPDKLPKYTVIQGLRVLTLVSDLPELNFDGTTFTFSSAVNITPVVSDLYGSGRSLLLDVEFCLDPGISLGSIPRCELQATRTTVVTAQAVATTATFDAPNYTGSLAAVTVDFSTASASALAIIGARFLAASTANQYNGVAMVIIVKLYPASASSTDESQTVTAMKRVILSSAAKVTKNSNPTGLEVRSGSTEIASLPTSNTELNAFLPTAQAETYTEYNVSGTLVSKTETLETTWFLTGPAEIECARKKECTSDGLFKLSRTKVNEVNLFYAPVQSLPSGRGRVLIAVARDNRGGIMMKRYLTGTGP
jgi:hypothetical protein